MDVIKGTYTQKLTTLTPEMDYNLTAMGFIIIISAL
jgi:hypothetical protein